MDIEPWMLWTGGVLLLLIIFYNRLIYLRNKVRETFKGIDVYLEQRFDALTKLAETVASYTDHEREVLERITELRSGFAHLSDNEKVKKTNEASALSRGINVESYPELQASSNFLHLQKSVYDIEEKLSAARRSYNARVIQYNTWTQSFPVVLFARIIGFTRKEMLEVEERKKQDIDLRAILRS